MPGFSPKRDPQGWKHISPVLTFVQTYGYEEKFERGLHMLESFFELHSLVSDAPKPMWQSRIKSWSVYEAPNLTTTMGYCRYSPVIALGLHSAVLVDPKLVNDLCEVFFHELAHGISYMLFHHDGHGHRWRWIFSQFGYQYEEITRCHYKTNELLAHKRKQSNDVFNELLLGG